MELHHIPLENLTVATINSRTHGVKEGLDSLTASIRAQGLLQPLLVRPVVEGEGYEIVAGQRRYLACQRLAQEQPVEPLPCLVLAATDDAAALEVSLTENLERLPMEPFDQHEAFARLVKLGQDVETIAARFGVTERLVRQRLALANLTDAIKREARKGAVGIADAQRLALATPKQQREWMKLYRDQAQYAPQGSQLKAWLCGGAAMATEVALFELADYPGRIITDLFGEQSYFDDAAAFWTLQNQAIAALREALLAKGWSQVEVLETGDFFKGWEHQRTPMERGGGVFVSPQRTGEVLVHEGYLPLKEARRLARQAAGEAGADPTEDAPKAARSEATQALQNYVALHKGAALRYQLTQQPALALRLVVACLIGGADNWSVRGDRTQPFNAAIEASVRASAARGLFADERRAVGQWLGGEAESAAASEFTEATLAGRGYGERRTAEVFGRLLELSDEQVLKILAVVAAEALVAGSGLAERLGEWLETDMRVFWQPDDAFVDLLTDKEALGRIAAELGGEPSHKATGADWRGLIRRRLNGEGCQPVAEWLPRYFQFPTRGYTDRPVSEARTAYDQLSRCWNGADPKGVPNAELDPSAAGQTEDAAEARAAAELDEAA